MKNITFKSSLIALLVAGMGIGTATAATVDDLDKIVTRHGKVIGAHEKVIQDHEKVIQTHEGAIKTHEGVINNHSDQLADHNDKLVKYKRTIDNHDSVITAHEGVIQTHEKVIQNHEKVIQTHEGAIKTHEGAIQTHEKVIQAHEKAIQTHENAIRESRANVAGLNTRIDSLGREIKNGLSTQAALNGLFQPYNVGKLNISAAVGGYRDKTALAVGSGFRFNEKFAMKAGVAVNANGGGGMAYNVGANFEF